MSHFDKEAIFEELAVLNFPFRDINLVILVFFALSFSWIEFVVRLMGVGGLIISMSLVYVSALFFGGYLFVILNYTARGFQHIPRLSGNLITEARTPLIQVFLLISTLISLNLIFRDTVVIWPMAFGSIMVAPVGISIVVISGSLVQALNPIRWISTLKLISFDGNFFRYLGLLAMMLIGLPVVVVLDWGWLNILKYVLFLGLAMTLFRAFGVVLHSNAEALGIKVNYGPQIIEDENDRAAKEDISNFMYEMYKLVGSGSGAQAFDLYQNRLSEIRYRYEAGYFERAMAWENSSLAIRAGQDYIGRLMKSGDWRKSWEVLEYCYQANNKVYKLKSSGDILKLQESADTKLKKEIIAHLLSCFDQDFPSHPRRGDALLEAAHLLIYELDAFDQAKEVLARIRQDYPEIAGSSRFASLESMIESDI